MSGHGKYISREEIGKIYEGDWKDGKREGKGTEIKADGERYSGAWKNNVQEGVGELRWPTGKWREGLWSRGRRVKWLGSEHVGGKRTKVVRGVGTVRK